MTTIEQTIKAAKTRLKKIIHKERTPELPTKLLPTTMVGSYPRPSWFTRQLLGRDIREAFKLDAHREAFEDAVRAVLKDQEIAGLDIVSDGQMWFDDYSGGIGAFAWYWYERINGFGPAKEDHPLSVYAEGIDALATAEWGAAEVTGPLKRGPLRLADLFLVAQRNTDRPVKFCVGQGPLGLGLHTRYTHYTGPRDLGFALAPIFNAEMRDLVKAGARIIQLEDMGVWIPNLTGKKSDFRWIIEVLEETLKGVNAVISFHFCHGNTWGNESPALVGKGYGEVLPHLYGLPVDQFVLDYAHHEMEGLEVLRDLPPDKGVALGVIDIRTLRIETPGNVASRIRKALRVLPAEKLTLTTDCGMKQLPRFCAFQKIKALAEGAAIVRKELGA